MTLEQPLTIFSSMDPVQDKNDWRDTYTMSSRIRGKEDTSSGKEFISQAVFRPEKKTGLAGDRAGSEGNKSGFAGDRTGSAGNKSGLAGTPHELAGDKTGPGDNKEKPLRTGSGPAMRNLFSGEQNSARELTPEEESGFAEKKLRAREYDRAKGRLRSLMETADVFLHSRETEDREKSSGEKKAGPGFSVSCSRENIGSLMNDFLEAASPLEQLLRENSFSPEECLRNVLIYEGMECGRKGITLRACRDSRLPETVEGFGGILQRALCELLEQAISRTHEGGTITVHTRADRPSGGFVNIYFRIDDNGDRISEQEMQTLFESQTSEGTDRSFRSGLFSAREAATLMGGSIHARSGSSGSRFTMAVTLRMHES